MWNSTRTPRSKIKKGTIITFSIKFYRSHKLVTANDLPMSMKTWDDNITEAAKKSEKTLGTDKDPSKR